MDSAAVLEGFDFVDTILRIPRNLPAATEAAKAKVAMMFEKRIVKDGVRDLRVEDVLIVVVGEDDCSAAPNVEVLSNFYRNWVLTLIKKRIHEVLTA